MTEAGTWVLDPVRMQVKHRGGLCLQIEGEITEPSAVVPLNVPHDMPPHQLAALIRQGTEFCRQYRKAPTPVVPQAEKVPHVPTRKVLRLKR